MNSVVGAGVGEPHTTHMFLTSVASGHLLDTDRVGSAVWGWGLVLSHAVWGGPGASETM